MGHRQVPDGNHIYNEFIAMNRIILHIDMDAFYAAVEQLDDPTLRGKPVIVGGTSNRGVVSAASYEARRFGVRSGIPIFQAREKCPQGIFLPVRMRRYKEMSRKIMGIVAGFTPAVEPVSIDEAFMDLTGTGMVLGPPEAIGKELKNRIKAATSLTCSIGIAPNKFLAKIASDMNKPDGLTVIHPEDVSGIVEHLPADKIPGVGEKTRAILKDLGIKTLSDVGKLPESLILNRIGKFGRRLLDFSKGLDESPVSPHSEVKSVSRETTLKEDTCDREVLERQLLIQSEIVGRRMRKKGVRGTTVTLKLKRADFKQMTRSVTLDKFTHSSQDIYQEGLKLFARFDESVKFRLVGIGVSNLIRGRDLPKQLDLFGDPRSEERNLEAVEKAVDVIKDRFGSEAIKRGRAVRPID
jgi:DNA polymerase-4